MCFSLCSLSLQVIDDLIGKLRGALTALPQGSQVGAGQDMAAFGQGQAVSCCCRQAAVDATCNSINSCPAVSYHALLSPFMPLHDLHSSSCPWSMPAAQCHLL